MRNVIIIAIALLIAFPAFGAGTDAPQRARVKALTESAATDFVVVTIPASGSYTSGIVRWRIEATDGTDYQARTGATYVVAVNKGGTVTCSVGDIGTTAVAVSAGTLTNTMTCTAGAGKVTVSANAVSSLTQTSLNIRYYVDLAGPSVSSGL